MRYEVKRAAVIGAGVMGAAIAAHLANVGVPVLLLDVPAEGEGREAANVRSTPALRAGRPLGAAHAGPQGPERGGPRRVSGGSEPSAASRPGAARAKVEG